LKNPQGSKSHKTANASTRKTITTPNVNMSLDFRPGWVDMGCPVVGQKFE